MFFFKISLECNTGYFGHNCNNSCGHCVNDRVCDHVDGTCDGGCKPGYQEPICDKGNNSKHMLIYVDMFSVPGCLFL